MLRLIILLAVALIPSVTPRQIYPNKYPACDIAQDCMDDEAIASKGGEYFCASECFTSMSHTDGCVYWATNDPGVCREFLPPDQTNSKLNTCQPCCRCWNPDNIGEGDRELGNNACVDVCPRRTGANDWNDCFGWELGGDAGGRTGGEIGGLAAATLVAAGLALEGL